MSPQVRAAWKFGRARRIPEQVIIATAIASILGFVIGGKVFSSQFALWLVPFLPLVLDGPLWVGMGIASAVLTTAEYPFLATALEMLEPGHARAVLIVGLRNVLFVVLYAGALRRIASSSPKAFAGWPRLLARRQGVL